MMRDTEETPLVHAADLLTTAEAAAMLNVSKMTITRWVRSGALKCLRRDPFIFHRQTVEAAMERSAR